MTVDGGAASDSVDCLSPISKDVKDEPDSGGVAACPLDHIPPEIRNEIFLHALVHDDPVEITERLPGLTATCKRFREEALGIYFGNNRFLARVVDFEEAPVIIWLNKLSSFWARYQPLILEVQVLNEGSCVEITSGFSQKVPPCSPNLECWDNIIAHLNDSGLVAKQVKWPSALLINIEANAWAGQRFLPYPFPTQSGIEATIHSRILPWLLKRHNLYDEISPPVDVMRELQGIYGKAVAAWIDQQRDRAGGCDSRYLNDKNAWWKKPVEEDPEWKERIQKYRERRQSEKDRKARAKRLVQVREDERAEMEALLNNESYVRTRVFPGEARAI